MPNSYEIFETTNLKPNNLCLGTLLPTAWYTSSYANTPISFFIDNSNSNENSQKKNIELNEPIIHFLAAYDTVYQACCACISNFHLQVKQYSTNEPTALIPTAFCTV